MNLNELLNTHRPYRTLIYLIETQASANAATWAMIQRPFRPWAPFMQQGCGGLRRRCGEKAAYSPHDMRRILLLMRRLHAIIMKRGN